MLLRIRKEGTREFVCNTLEAVLEAARNVVETASYAVVNDQCLDLTTANLIVNVCENLNEKNTAFIRQKFSDWCRDKGEEAALKVLVSVCWKCV